MPIKLVVGLGNPGEKYVKTRHNVGYRVLDLLKENSPPGAKLFKPEGFMNQAGVSVAEKVRRNGYQPGEVLVVCDDFMLPLGTPRIRLGGSSGGHNGLDSILQTLGTQEVPRLRGGIGPVPEGRDPADFVLESFSGQEQMAKVELFIPLLAKIVQDIVAQGLEFAMNQYNNKGL